MATMKRVFTLTALVLPGLFLIGMAGWGTLALQYFDHANPGLRTGLAAAFAVASLAAFAGFAVRRLRWRTFAAYFVLCALLLWRWSAIEPSNDRPWQAEVAVLPYATVDGDRVTVHNVRNFDYRSETDFTPAYYTRSYDLRELDSVDLVVSYWMGPHIAHTFLSFGFGGKDYLAISIETRKEKGRATRRCRDSFVSTSCTMWPQTSGTRFACAPITVLIRAKTCIYTG